MQRYIDRRLSASLEKSLAHYHGGLLNASKLGQALDVSNKTVRRYLDILEETFMVRVLPPWKST